MPFIISSFAHVAGGIPSNTRHSPIVVSMLVHRLRRWPNIDPTMCDCFVFAGILYRNYHGERRHCQRKKLCIQFCKNIFVLCERLTSMYMSIPVNMMMRLPSAGLMLGLRYRR